MASSLYPTISPYREGYLDVGGGHLIYWEESGSPSGFPILFLHGGPGLGTSTRDRSFFDPSFYRIILFDQRGCGKSLPFASLENNTTWDLVSDIEKLRIYLGVDKWLLFGGSWGSSLALTYAIQHSERVAGLILRGIFLCRPKEIYWFYQDGANHVFPDFWENYLVPIPHEERGDLLQAFYKQLREKRGEARSEAIKAWAMWEGNASRFRSSSDCLDRLTPREAYAMAKIETHYFTRQAFFETDNWILENLTSVHHLPCIIIQGRYDMVCPMQSAWELHLSWPEAEFRIIPDAGHSASEPAIAEALVQATDFFRNQMNR